MSTTSHPNGAAVLLTPVTRPECDRLLLTLRRAALPEHADQVAFAGVGRERDCMPSVLDMDPSP